MDLAGLLFNILNIVTLVLIARAICSWIDPGFNSRIGRLIFDVTEPLLAPIRQLLPPMGMLDLSIMVALFLVYILRTLIAQSLA